MTWPNPPLTLDEALAAYAAAMAEVVAAARAAAITKKAWDEARVADDAADRECQAARRRLTDAALVVERVQERALAATQPATVAGA
jgi:nucleotide-binding universal stress UspA family protein